MKKAFICLCSKLGIIRLFQFLNRNKIAILMIHGVMYPSEKSLWKPLRSQLSPGKLDEYIRVLSETYTFISLSDACDMLAGRKPVRPNSLVLTFDDGYRNNFTHALPVLRKYNVPATFYVPTGFLDNPRPFWWDRLDYVIQQIKEEKRNVKLGDIEVTIENGNRDILEKSFRYLRRAAKKQHMPDHVFIREIENLTIQLEQESGRSLVRYANDDWSAIATWDIINQEKSQFVSIGSHTIDHVRLGLVEKHVARDQLKLSKEEIETRTGMPCLSISYPNGSFNNETLKLTKECGYQSGVTVEEGLNKKGDNLFTLKRFNVPIQIDTTEFLGTISGLLSTAIYIKNILLYPVNLLKKLGKGFLYSFRLMKSHGIKKAIERVGSEIYSNKEYIIMLHDLKSFKEFDIDRNNLSIDSLSLDDTDSIEELCDAWPKNWRSKHLKTKVISDLEKGDTCFLLRSNSNIIGAAWLNHQDGIIKHYPGSHRLGEGIITSLFLVPQERGKGLSKLIINHIIKEAKQREMPQVFGYIQPSRIASIKTQLKVGFFRLGTLKVKNRMGKSKYSFMPNTDKESNPESIN